LRVEARAFISKLHQSLGTTFIYVTHDQVEAMTMGTRIAVLSAGKLQQLDTPTNLYQHPQNQFVAGFIGSPSMNFFNATLKEVDGKMVVDTGFANLEVPVDRVDRYRPNLGKKVTLGIRPENIHNTEYRPSSIIPQLVEAEVDVVELMGHEKVVYLLAEGTTFLARMDPRSDVHIGLKTPAVFDMANMHLFDVETGLTL
jgi:multiple sugar transport system ATP-binding protein